MNIFRSEYDPAYDQDNSDFQAYIIDFDESHLTVLPGKTPIAYHCDEPGFRQMVDYGDFTGRRQLGYACFVNHVKRIEGNSERGGEPWSDKLSIRRGQVTETWIKKSKLTVREVTSVGATIFLHAEQDEEERKN